MRVVHYCLAITACLLLDSCALTHRLHRNPATATVPATAVPLAAGIEVPSAFVGEAQSGRDLDSIASWLAENGDTWVIATASTSDQLVVFDGNNGKRLRSVGSSGTGPGQFRHPAGITAFADLLFVVERDNHRVQVLQLPDFKPLGSFGDQQLRNPDGIWLRETAPAEYEVLVTDNDPAGTPKPRLGERVQRFRVSADGGVLHADFTRAFGSTRRSGALPTAGWLMGDDANQRVAIAEGANTPGAHVHVYKLGGHYTGKDLGGGRYRGQAGGLALYACGDSDGYWIGVDRNAGHSALLVFDRKRMSYLGSVVSKQVTDASAIALQPASSTQFPDGVLYALSDHASIIALDWHAIAQALALPADCR